MPLYGADADRGADPAIARAPGGGLPPSGTGSPSVWSACAEAIDDHWRLNGYHLATVLRKDDDVIRAVPGDVGLARPSLPGGPPAPRGLPQGGPSHLHAGNG